MSFQKLPFLSLIFLVVLLAVGSVVEHYSCTAAAREWVYVAPWTLGLWAVAVSTGVWQVWKRRRQLHCSGVLLHVAFVVMLSGALLTHAFSIEGRLEVHASAEAVDGFIHYDDEGRARVVHFPFAVQLDSCAVLLHPNSARPKDYQAHLRVIANDHSYIYKVQMNQPLRRAGWRFYLMNLQGQRASFSVVHDPWGIAVTYLGYAFFLLAMLAVLCKREGRFRILFSQLRKVATKKPPQIPEVALLVLLCVAAVSVLAYRGICGGYFPASNGHETLLWLAVVVMASALAVARRISGSVRMGWLLGGIVFGVAWMFVPKESPQSLLPVLDSPLLALHVLLVVVGYACILLASLTSAQALFRKKKADHEETNSLVDRILLLLYLSLFFLGAGILLGAVWANLSWGTYWSWDPKETWALITWMLYALPLHAHSVSLFQRPRFLYAYCLVAFLAVLMTYFGVNYLLGGMHSYA